MKGNMAKYNEFGCITIDDARIDETCNAYFKWKDLNTYISNNSHRGINMPDAISEPMGCYCMGFLWNRGDEVGDATDPNTGRKIETKRLNINSAIFVALSLPICIWKSSGEFSI